MRTIVALSKLTLFVVLCLIVVPPQIIILLIHKGKYSYFIPLIFHISVCKIFCIKIAYNLKKLPQNQQMVFVGNHLSYLDIPVIGSILQASFVAKDDVSSWPVFGFLSKMQQTLFISRERNTANSGNTALDQAIDQDKSLIIFPEGTSTDGQEVLPFKSSLFSIFFSEKMKIIPIVPFTVNLYPITSNTPNQSFDRDLYAWHINMDTPLGKHLWKFAKSKGATIGINMHDPLFASQYSDRKTLALACHEAVSKGLAK